MNYPLFSLVFKDEFWWSVAVHETGAVIDSGAEFMQQVPYASRGLTSFCDICLPEGSRNYIIVAFTDQDDFMVNKEELKARLVRKSAAR